MNSDAMRAFLAGPQVETAAGTSDGGPATPKPCPLTDYQLAILKWVAAGKRYYDIAQIMGNTTEEAVAMHFHRMHAKFGTNTPAALVAFAMREGWIK